MRPVEELTNRVGDFLAVGQQTPVSCCGNFYEACVWHRRGGFPDA
jgi:hypothetical protein